MIEFKNISKSYPDGNQAIKDISLKVEEGEFVTLIGPSGCGKTTTLKMVNRLIDPTSGSILINGRNITDYNINELRWNTGYVLQEIALFPHLTVEENIAIVPELMKWDKEKLNNRIDELMDMVGLEPAKFRKRMPNELSGGQQQRVGVIRALAGDPDIILMDEPFSALDPITREQLQKDIHTIQRQIKKTILFVTHDLEEAFRLGDRVCLMHEGEIAQFDTPEKIMLEPKNAFVENFTGKQKTPWQTTIEVIIQDSSLQRIVIDNKDTLEYPPNGVYALVDINDKYDGLLSYGKIEKPVPLQVNHTLGQASSIFQENKQSVLPVVDGEKFIGLLTTNEVLAYLYKESNLQESGTTV